MKTPEEQAEIDRQRNAEIQRQNSRGVPQPDGKMTDPATATGLNPDGTERKPGDGKEGDAPPSDTGERKNRGSGDPHTGAIATGKTAPNPAAPPAPTTKR